MAQAFQTDAFQNDTFEVSAGGPTTHSLSGTISGTGSVTGTILLVIALSGNCVCSSTLTGTPVHTAYWGMSQASASDGRATVSGSPGLTIGLSGTAAGASSVSGAPYRLVYMDGACAGYATVSPATLLRTQPVSGTAAGAATVSGSPAVIGNFSGTISGTSSLADWIVVTRNLSGTSAGTSSASGSLVQVRVLSGTAAGSASLSGQPSLTIGFQASTAAGVGRLSGEPRDATFRPPLDGLDWARADLLGVDPERKGALTSGPEEPQGSGSTSPSISPANAARIQPVHGSARRL